MQLDKHALFLTTALATVAANNKVSQGFISIRDLRTLPTELKVNII